MRENIWKNIKLGFKTNKLAVVGAAAIILLALISIFAFLFPVFIRYKIIYFSNV